MFKQPPAQKTDPWTGATSPVERERWGYFCTEDQGKELLLKVQKLVPDAQLLDGLGSYMPWPITYLDDTTKMWMILGTMPNGDSVAEYAGQLYDRMMWPFNAEDGARWGPNLAAVPIAPGLVQLMWVR